MTDLRKAIIKAVSRKQRGIKIRPGDHFRRGTDMVAIISRSKNEIEYRSLYTGKTHRLRHSDFTEYGLERVKIIGKQTGDLLRIVWGYASTKSLPFRNRVRIIKSFLPDSKDDEEIEKMKSWIFALSREMEPMK